jgi:hypothetical protein
MRVVPGAKPLRGYRKWPVSLWAECRNSKDYKSLRHQPTHARIAPAQLAVTKIDPGPRSCGGSVFKVADTRVCSKKKRRRDRCLRPRPWPRASARQAGCRSAHTPGPLHSPKVLTGGATRSTADQSKRVAGGTRTPPPKANCLTPTTTATLSRERDKPQPANARREKKQHQPRGKSQRSLAPADLFDLCSAHGPDTCMPSCLSERALRSGPLRR